MAQEIETANKFKLHPQITPTNSLVKAQTAKYKQTTKLHFKITTKFEAPPFDMKTSW